MRPCSFVHALRCACALLLFVGQACDAAGLTVVDASLLWLKHHSMLSADAHDGIIIGASSLAHLTANIAACDADAKLPQAVVDAFNAAWDVCRPACPKYFRP